MEDCIDSRRGAAGRREPCCCCRCILYRTQDRCRRRRPLGDSSWQRRLRYWYEQATLRESVGLKELGEGIDDKIGGGREATYQ